MRAIVFVALVALFLYHADAATFVVNSAAFLPDTNPGDGICRTAVSTCTLQAAIMESNARPALDRIELQATTYRTDENVDRGGFDIRERVTIVGKGAPRTILTGRNQERHFDIRNEKLIMGLRNGENGAYRPSSGRRIGSITSTGSVPSSAGAFIFASGYMYTSYFIQGIHRYRRRTREEIQRTPTNRNTYVYDRRIVDGSNGNGAGLTSPTTIALDRDRNLLVNSFQPTNFGIRRYNKDTGAYMGLFIRPPGIVNSMINYLGKIYVTLVSDGRVQSYDARTGAYVRQSSRLFRTPRGITVCDGRIFVADEEGNRIVELSEDLAYIRTIVSDPGRLIEPQGIACFASGDLFIKLKGQKLYHYRFGTTSSTYVRDLSIPSNFIAGIAAVVNEDYHGGPGVTIQRMTLRDGAVPSSVTGPSVNLARGCWNHINQCIVRNNLGSVWGGAISNSGTMIITRTRLFRNSMPEYSLDGGGVTNSGGAIGNFGRLTVQYSELSRNQAARGGAIWGSGGEGFVTILQSTISDNFAGNAGGGLYNTRYMEVIWSTVTNNRCGKFSGDPVSRRAGCGFYSARNPSNSNSYFIISSSIIAGNVQEGNLGTHAPDCLAETASSVRSMGGNILGSVDSTKCRRYFRTYWDRVGTRTSPVDAGLANLSFLRINGRRTGPTRGHNPNAGSLPTSFQPFPSGDNPVHSCPSRDQIGRRRKQGGICDVGSIEREV